MTRSLPFTQSDVSRAVKGARAGGLTVRRVEIDQTGKIVLVADDEQRDEDVGTRQPNEWDDVLDEAS